MQGYAEWKKYKLKQSSQNEPKETTFSGLVPNSGFVTLFCSFGILMVLIGDFFIAPLLKIEDYSILKHFYGTLVFLVMFPGVIVLKNDKIVKHAIDRWRENVSKFANAIQKMKNYPKRKVFPIVE